MDRYTYLYRETTREETAAILRGAINGALLAKYGTTIDPVILRRIEEEWEAIKRTDSLLDIAALHELTTWLRQNHYPYWVRGCGGSSLILYLLGITFGNPLPPHRYCADCGTVEWMPMYKDGFDVPQGTCSYCGDPAEGDGHDIDHTMLFSYDGIVGFYITVTPQVHRTLLRAWEDHWLKDIVPDVEEDNGYDPYGAKFIKLGKLWITFSATHGIYAPRFFQQKLTVEDRTFLLDNAVCFLDEYTDFKHTLPLPNTIADLIALYGLSHSDGAWDKVSACMVRDMGYRPAELIAFHDNVYRYLIDHGFSEKDAEQNMGDAKSIATDEMRSARDKWVLDRCRRIEKLRYKAEAVEYMHYWFKADLMYEYEYDPWNMEYEYMLARARQYCE